MLNSPSNTPEKQANLSFHDVLRQLSADFNVNAQQVSEVLESIARSSHLGEGKAFCDASFGLEYLPGEKGEEKIIVVTLMNGEKFFLETVKGRGVESLNGKRHYFDFQQLRLSKRVMGAEPIPNARPSDPHAADRLSDPFNDFWQQDDVEEIAPSTRARVLGTIHGPDSFRGFIFEDEGDSD